MWSRSGAADADQEFDEEEKAMKKWNQEQKEGKNEVKVRKERTTTKGNNV